MTNVDAGDGLTPEARFGRAVREAREEFGWTQSDLASHMSSMYSAGYTQSTIAKTEAGTRPVRLNEAAALAIVLRRDLALMIRTPGPYNDLTRQLRTVQASIRDLDRQGKKLRVERAEMDSQAEELRIRLEYLEQREGHSGGVDQEA